MIHNPSNHSPHANHSSHSHYSVFCLASAWKSNLGLKVANPINKTAPAVQKGAYRWISVVRGQYRPPTTNARFDKDSCRPLTVPDNSGGDALESVDSSVDETTPQKVPKSVTTENNINPPVGANIVAMADPNTHKSTKRAVPILDTSEEKEACEATEAIPTATKNSPRMDVERFS